MPGKKAIIVSTTPKVITKPRKPFIISLLNYNSEIVCTFIKTIEAVKE